MKKIKNIVIPKCPVCESDNVQKLENNENKWGMGLIRIITGRSIKVYECNNCKLKWKDEYSYNK